MHGFCLSPKVRVCVSRSSTCAYACAVALCMRSAHLKASRVLDALHETNVVVMDLQYLPHPFIHFGHTQATWSAGKQTPYQNHTSTCVYLHACTRCICACRSHLHEYNPKRPNAACGGGGRGNTRMCMLYTCTCACLLTQYFPCPFPKVIAASISWNMRSVGRPMDLCVAAISTTPRPGSKK